MTPKITLPESLPQDCLRWRTPQDEVDYWGKHPKTRMPYDMWERYYCVTTQHRGFHCTGCMSDEEYTGIPNYDDKCCCRGDK